MKRLTVKNKFYHLAHGAPLAAALSNAADKLCRTADRTLTAVPPLAVTLSASKRGDNADGNS